MPDRTSSTDPDSGAARDSTHDAAPDRSAGDRAARPDPGAPPPGEGVRSEVEPRSGEEVRRSAGHVERLERRHRPMDDDAGIVPDRGQDSSGDPEGAGSDRSTPGERS